MSENAEDPPVESAAEENKNEKPAKPPRPPRTPRSKGGIHTHLPDEAKDTIIEMIVEGRVNHDIDLRLRADGHIGPRDVVSYVTYQAYRRLPEAQVKVGKLTEEAIQSGHSSLSKHIVYLVRLHEQCARAIIGEKELRTGDIHKLRLASRNFFESGKFIWLTFGWKDVLATLQEQERSDIAEVQRSNADDEEKMRMILDLRERYSLLLGQVVSMRDRDLGVDSSRALATGTALPRIAMPDLGQYAPEPAESENSDSDR